MSAAPDGRPRTWVKRKHLDDDAWVIECFLCGKHARRVFRTDKHDDTKQAAADYVGEHLASPPHEAAVTAYRQPLSANPEDDLTKEERVLQSIFGTSADWPPTDEQRRRGAAKKAAARAGLRRHR